MKKGKLFSLLIMGVCVASYATDIPEVFKRIFGDDVSIMSAVKEMPQNASQLIDKTYELLGDPKANFQQGMDGFITVAHEFNPSATGHGNYDRIYEVMDLKTFINKIKENEI